MCRNFCKALAILTLSLATLKAQAAPQEPGQREPAAVTQLAADELVYFEFLADAADSVATALAGATAPQLVGGSYVYPQTGTIELFFVDDAPGVSRLGYMSIVRSGAPGAYTYVAQIQWHDLPPEQVAQAMEGISTHGFMPTVDLTPAMIDAMQALLNNLTAYRDFAAAHPGAKPTSAAIENGVLSIVFTDAAGVAATYTLALETQN